MLELLRVEAAPTEWVETSEGEIAAGLALLGEVRAAADGLGCAQGALWQALLYEQPGGGSSGGGGGSGPVVQRTPLKRAGRSFSLDGTELLGFVGLEPLGPQRRRALGAGAVRLRGLLRLSLMDDNDLQLARRALSEAAAFFGPCAPRRRMPAARRTRCGRRSSSRPTRAADAPQNAECTPPPRSRAHGRPLGHGLLRVLLLAPTTYTDTHGWFGGRVFVRSWYACVVFTECWNVRAHNRLFRTV